MIHLHHLDHSFKKLMEGQGDWFQVLYMCLREVAPDGKDLLYCLVKEVGTERVSVIDILLYELDSLFLFAYMEMRSSYDVVARFTLTFETHFKLK